MSDGLIFTEGLKRANGSSPMCMIYPSDQSMAHFGVKGMHWGVRNASSVAEEGTGKSTATLSSEDAARAARTEERIRTHGVGSVSNADLQHLVNRKNLERQHGKLDQRQVSAGEKAAKEVLVQIGKQKAAALGASAIAAGAAAATVYLSKAFNVR